MEELVPPNPNCSTEASSSPMPVIATTMARHEKPEESVDETMSNVGKDELIPMLEARLTDECYTHYIVLRYL
uniref:Uncharacterized protein n=1 Tax=Oryza punctata TaxID=4537 RepID=A0A0E0LYK7_ORYPU